MYVTVREETVGASLANQGADIVRTKYGVVCIGGSSGMRDSSERGRLTSS